MNYKKISLVVFSLFVISSILYSSFLFAGFIKHEAISPFGIGISFSTSTSGSGQSQEYTSTMQGFNADNPDQHKTVLYMNYRDLDVYGDAEEEPYCKVGGQYRVRYYNDPRPGPGAGVTDSDNVASYNGELFYCKTTQDLINLIKIPSSWSEDNPDLILYCNDANRINSDEFNFEFITDQLNTYKVCVLKNMDLDANNTVFYGFEVGNREVDSYETYYFNFSTNQSDVLTGLDYFDNTGLEADTQRKLAGEVNYPYKRIEVEENDPETGMTTTRYVYSPLSENEALEKAKEDFGDDVVEVENLYNNSEERISKFKYYVNIEMPRLENVYVDEYDNKYYFNYKSSENFYSLKNFEEPLDTSLSISVPDIGISRIAILNKIGDKVAIGYELSANNAVSEISDFNTSVSAVYHIDLRQFGFDESKCNDFLSFYNPVKNDWNGNTKIICKSDYIKIISENIDSSNEKFKAYNLFKNIILGMR